MVMIPSPINAQPTKYQPQAGPCLLGVVQLVLKHTVASVYGHDNICVGAGDGLAVGKGLTPIRRCAFYESEGVHRQDASERGGEELEGLGHLAPPFFAPPAGDAHRAPGHLWVQLPLLLQQGLAPVLHPRKLLSAL